MKKLIKKFGLLVLLAAIALVIFPLQGVFACSPGGPNPWFATQLSFDQASLPNNIEMVQADPVYEQYALINKSSEPFYLIRENLTDWKTFLNSELPKNYEPRYKITASQVYFWGQLSSQDTEGWKLNSGGINNSAATRVRIDDSVYTLEGESKQIFQDNRPTVVEIPEFQNFKILAFYKGAPVEIRGALHYSLNDKYDPQAFAKGVEACNKLNQSLNSTLWRILSFAPLIIILLILSGVGFLTYKIIKRFRK